MLLADDHARVLHVLDEDECHRLLRSAPVGRLAFTEGALPTIQPVSFVVAGDDVVIPTGTGSKVAVAARGAVVAFEVDEFDAARRTGWNVTVVGPSRVISEPAEVAALDALGARDWAPAGVRCYVAVRIALVRGRRLALAPAVVPAASAPPDRA